MTADTVLAEIEKAVSDGWVYTDRQSCVWHQMQRVEPIIRRLLNAAVRDALQACWDEYEALMPDSLHTQVRAALGLRMFTGEPPWGVPTGGVRPEEDR